MDNKILLSELAEKLAAQSEISKRAAEAFLRTFFSLVEQNMLSDRFVKIKDIGTFKLVDVNERESVNVATGERIQIEGHSKISFVAEGKLRDLVNRPFAYLTNIELEDETTLEELNNVDKAAAIEEAPYAPEEEEAVPQEEFAPQPEQALPVTPPVYEGGVSPLQEPLPLAEWPAEQEMQPAASVPTPEDDAATEIPAAATTPADISSSTTPTPHTQAQEIALALLKIIQTAQGSHLTPQELVSAFQMLQTPAAEEPENTSGAEAQEEEQQDVAAGRRERRRARRDGKRLPIAARSLASTPAAPSTLKLVETEASVEEPTAEENRATPAPEEDTQKPLRLKDRHNRRQRNRPIIKRTNIPEDEDGESLNALEEEVTPSAAASSPQDATAEASPVETTPVETSAETLVPPSETSQDATPVSQEVVASLQEIMQSPSDLAVALQEVTQSPQEVMQILQELTQSPASGTTPSSQPAQTGDEGEFQRFVRPVRQKKEGEEENEEDNEKARFKKIGIIVAIALLLLGLLFYLFYYHEPQKELIEDPLGLEQVKKANNADNVNADTIRAQELSDPNNPETIEKDNSQPAYTDNSKNIKQLPNAGYEILGTAKEYTMKQGESLNYVALTTLGSSDLVNYIIFYNDLTNITNLGPGSKVNIPILRRRSSGKIINRK